MTITVREVLDGASGTSTQSLAIRRSSKTSMRRTLGRAYLSLGATDQGDEHLERALAIFRERGDSVEMAVTEVVRSKGLLDLGKFDEGERRLRSALPTLRQHTDRIAPDVLASAVNNLALTVTRRDPRSEEGLALMREAIALARNSSTTDAMAANLAVNLGLQLLVSASRHRRVDAARRTRSDRSAAVARPERGWALRQLSELMRTKGDSPPPSGMARPPSKRVRRSFPRTIRPSRCSRPPGVEPSPTTESHSAPRWCCSTRTPRSARYDRPVIRICSALSSAWARRIGCRTGCANRRKS